MPRITFELYGIPRRRAGRAEVAVDATTVFEALEQLQQSCPGLTELLQQNQLNPHYSLSLNAQILIQDLSLPLEVESRLLLFSADIGG